MSHTRREESSNSGKREERKKEEKTKRKEREQQKQITGKDLKGKEYVKKPLKIVSKKKTQKE